MEREDNLLLALEAEQVFSPTLGYRENNYNLLPGKASIPFYFTVQNLQRTKNSSSTKVYLSFPGTGAHFLYLYIFSKFITDLSSEKGTFFLFILYIPC
jgi:hypothetical protein